MKQYKSFLNIGILSLGIIIYSFHKTSYACTIMSGVAPNGHVWNANNEDGPFGVSNFINVFPKQETSKYGYATTLYVIYRQCLVIVVKFRVG